MDPALLKIRRERAELLAAELAAETGIPASCILGRTRDPEVVPVRHRLWRMLNESGLSSKSIGAALGVDHTSVCKALRKIRRADRSEAA